MIAVDYEEEEGFFHRLIRRTSWVAAMVNTTGRICDSRVGFLLDSYSPQRRVSRGPSESRPADRAGTAQREERIPVPMTMMPVGRHLEQVYEFGAQRRIQLSPDVIVRAVLGTQETEDTCKEGERLKSYA